MGASGEALGSQGNPRVGLRMPGQVLEGPRIGLGGVPEWVRGSLREPGGSQDGFRGLRVS